MQNKIIKTAILILLSMVVIGCSNYYQQGKVYEKKEDYNSAIEAYKKMVEKSDSNKRAIAQSEIGRLYVKLGKYWDAKENLEKAKKELNRADSRYAEVCFNLGYCYYEKGDSWFNQAIAEFNEALKVKEDFSKAHFYMSVIYYRHKEYEGALNHLASVKGEHKVQAKHLAGLCYWRLLEYKKAANMVREAIELEKDKTVRSQYQDTLVKIEEKWETFRKQREKIVKVNLNPVFASIYKYYAKSPIGTAVIRNPTDKTLHDVKVVLNVSPFMDEPALNPVGNIPPNKEIEVELKAAFNKKMCEVQDDIENKPISLTLEYTTNGDKKSESKQGVYLDIYDVNATNWKPNESIAAFVAHNNTTVQTIARYAANADNNLEKAIRVYDTLNKYGIGYSLDPEDPYGEDIDYIMYPWETLKVKKGDCDDLSVLYAACLQNIGINTALVLTPSHVFVMFDSGMSKSRANRVIPDQNLYRVEEGTAWIPVEVTMLGKQEKSFFDAWLKAKEEYNPDLQRVYIARAWKRFKPTWSGADESEVELPDKNAVLREYYDDIVKAKEYWQDIIDKDIKYQLTQLKSQPTDNAQIRNLLGISYAINGEFANAEKNLRKATVLEPSVTRYHNNLANVLLLQGRLQEAEKEYDLALQRSPDSAAVRVNMAIYYFAQQKPDKAQSVIRESPDKEKLVAIAKELGIPVTSSPRAGVLESRIKDKTQKAAQIREKKRVRKRLANQIIGKAMPDATKKEKQKYKEQLSELSIKKLQKLSEDEPLEKDLVLKPKKKPEGPKISPEQMKKLLDDVLGSAEVSGTKAAGISEPEGLQWWLNWMK